MARFIRTDRLAGALHRQAQSALRAPPGARARYYDEQRDRGLDHNAALRVAKDDASIAPPRNPCAIVCPGPRIHVRWFSVRRIPGAASAAGPRPMPRGLGI